ncbi:MAG: hypothetical protein QOG65_3028 [Actinomycetota bacterium]|nr:hypothetical protein [Actinomycetota bacterium]
MPRQQLKVRAEAITSATPPTLWALLADATSYANWGPWNASGYEDPSFRGKDALRWMRYGRKTTVERILELEENRRLVYSVERGIPVRGYRAEVTLAPTPDGTRVTWSAQWDRTLLGRVVHWKLRTLYPEVMAKLIAAAEAADASTRTA